MRERREVLRRKIERLEAILANITRLSDIARNDRPPTIDDDRAAAKEDDVERQRR